MSCVFDFFTDEFCGEYYDDGGRLRDWGIKRRVEWLEIVERDRSAEGLGL